jgi:multicomponent Na+:H+ antiporter subunit D
MATLVGAIVTGALLFAVRYFDAVGNLFHALMLVFMAAMVGFALSGDLFNMFVFFELMSVSAYALTAYKIEEKGPLEGAINFAITNSVGAFMVLIGIGLLYGRTGALNLAQMGTTLAHARMDMLLVTALLLVLLGFLVKAAAFPVHFWLADAHAVAPIPVCVLFSGVMVELGLYAVARVYWTVFSGPMSAHAGDFRNIVLWMGVATAVVGAVMCVTQRHLKRLLAFSTVSHMGIFLMGFSLLTVSGLAGSAAYLVAHGLAKASLFMCVGVLLHRYANVEEHSLRGAGRAPGLRPIGVTMAAGGVLIAAAPMFGTFFGKSLLEDGLTKEGYGWAIAVIVLASVVGGLWW